MEGRTMTKLLVLAMALVFSVTMVSAGYAQTTGTTEKKADSSEKKAEKKADKAEKKAEKAEMKAEKAEKKAEKKKAEAKEKKIGIEAKKKDAANPCAAKSAEKK